MRTDESVWPYGCRLLQMIRTWISSSAYRLGLFSIPCPHVFSPMTATCVGKPAAGGIRLAHHLLICVSVSNTSSLSVHCLLMTRHWVEWKCLEIFWLQPCHCLFSSVLWFTGLHSLYWISHERCKRSVGSPSTPFGDSSFQCVCLIFVLLGSKREQNDMVSPQVWIAEWTCGSLVLCACRELLVFKESENQYCFFLTDHVWVDAEEAE